MGQVRLEMETGATARDLRDGKAGFWALIATQFQGALSDNALKWLVSFLVLEAGVSREQRDFLFVLVVPLVFAVPFLVFSIPGGYFEDRFSKRSVTIWTKVLEVLTMGSGPRARVSDCVAGVRGNGVCAGTDAPGIVAVRATVDAFAAKG
jgi:hypothetical protein